MFHVMLLVGYAFILCCRSFMHYFSCKSLLDNFVRLHVWCIFWYIAYFSFWAFSHCKSLVFYFWMVFTLSFVRLAICIVMMSATLLDTIFSNFFKIGIRFLPRFRNLDVSCSILPYGPVNFSKVF